MSETSRAHSQTVEGHMEVQETRFVCQGPQMVQAQSEGNLRSYMYEPGRFAPMAHFDQTIREDGSVSKGQLYYFHTDGLGTPLEVTDAAGTLAWSGHYSALGQAGAHRCTSRRKEHAVYAKSTIH